MSGLFWALKRGRPHSIVLRSGRLPPRGSGPGLAYNSVLKSCRASMGEMTGVPDGTHSSPCCLANSPLAASAARTETIKKMRIFKLTLTRINTFREEW